MPNPEKNAFFCCLGESLIMDFAARIALVKNLTTLFFLEGDNLLLKIFHVKREHQVLNMLNTG